MLSAELPLPGALASGNGIVTIFPEGVSPGSALIPAPLATFEEVLLGDTRGPWPGHSGPGRRCELCGPSRPLAWGQRGVEGGPSGQEQVAGRCRRSSHHRTPGWQGGGSFLRASCLCQRESRALRLSHAPPTWGSEQTVVWVHLGWRLKGSEDGEDRLRLSSCPGHRLYRAPRGHQTEAERGGPNSVPLWTAGGPRR